MTFFKKHIALVLTTVMVLLAFSVNAQKFTARASKSEIPMDGAFRITYTLENVNAKEFTPPDFSPFRSGSPSRSSNTSIFNNQVTRSTTYTFTLYPTKEGEFEIPPATANVKGKVMKTNPVNIRVLPAGSASTDAKDNGNDDEEAELLEQIRNSLFVRVIPSKTTVFEGEQVTLTYKLYQALSLDDINIHKMPNFDGFLSYEIEVSKGDQQPKLEVYNDIRYNVSTIHQVAIFPSRSGTFTIEPMEVTSQVIIQRRDPRFIFPRSERFPYDFKSNNIQVNVKPLPSEGKPAGFTGAVGQYDMSVAYDKTNTQVDDPITLKIKVSGNGNIKLLDVTPPEFPQSFEVYDPKIKEGISKKSYTVNGSKNWEYLIIPRGGGSFQMPDIEFSYFDISKGEYVSIMEAGPLVEVEGEALSPQNYPAGGLSKEEVELLGEDIRFIKTGKLVAAPASANIITRPVFHALAWLPLLMATLLPVFYRRRRKRFDDVSAMRSRKAHKEAGKRMALARKLIKAGEDKAFYNEVVKSIWGYLSDKFDLGNAELSKENTRQLLQDYGITEQLQDAVYKLISTCEMAVYAPMAISESKEALVEEAGSIIEQLDKEINSA